MFVLNEKSQMKNKAVIKIAGVGGGGCNTIDYMVSHPIEGVELLAFNTDAQSLEQSVLRRENPDACLQIGKDTTRGLGAGQKVQTGKEAAMEDRESIRDMLSGADMVFVAAGMGGGTGSGAAPVIAEIARACGSLTVAVVTKPFHVEGATRMRIAEESIDELTKHVDSLITIPNEKLLGILDKDVLMSDACIEVDKVLHNAVQGIAELITRRGQFNNLDFADVKTIMTETGIARIGVGVASGDNRAYEAANIAIRNPLLDDINMSDIKGVLVNITAGENFRLKEYREIAECIQALATVDANVMVGQVVDKDLEDEIRVTLVATGLEDSIVDKQEIEPLVDLSATKLQEESKSENHPDLNSVSSKEFDSLRTKEEEKDKQYQQQKKAEGFGDHLDIPTFLRDHLHGTGRLKVGEAS